MVQTPILDDASHLEVEVSDQFNLDEILPLYDSVGWSEYTDRPSALLVALAGSSRVVTARRAGQLVGLARVISDGATICLLQDLLVHPEVHRQGVGRALLDLVMEPYRGVRQKVLLTDDEPGQRAFYEAVGYVEVRQFGDGHLRAFVRFD